MRKFRFHFLGLVHLPCSPRYNACAYTQKNIKLAKMLSSLGHEVVYYGAEGSEVACSRFVQTHTLRDLRQDYGDGDNRFEIGYDYRAGNFREDFNPAEKMRSTKKFYECSIREINAAKRDDDFLLLTMGYYHKPVHDGTKMFLTCEPGIGYRGSYARFRAFESAHLRSYMQGVEAERGRKDIDGHAYDRVIPNYFDPDEFTFRAEKKDYVLYMGRLIARKGVYTAYLAAKDAGVHLKIAGQGGLVRPDGSFASKVDPSVSFPSGGWEYVGYADVGQRRELLANAAALLVPTVYLEPFAGVHVEAMLSGTPPITSDFGVFPGTIPDRPDGVVGFRCNTLGDYVMAIRRAGDVDHAAIRKHGERYLMDNVRWEFQKWFEDLYDVYESAVEPGKGKGWYRIYENEPLKAEIR